MNDCLLFNCGLRNLAARMTKEVLKSDGDGVGRRCRCYHLTVAGHLLRSHFFHIFFFFREFFMHFLSSFLVKIWRKWNQRLLLMTVTTTTAMIVLTAAVVIIVLLEHDFLLLHTVAASSLFSSLPFASHFFLFLRRARGFGGFYLLSFSIIWHLQHDGGTSFS